MAEKRIICIGTGNRWTNPPSIKGENGRFYEYPGPGVIHTWDGDATAPVTGVLDSQELIAAAPGGPPIQGYGLLVLGDTYMHLMRTTLESEEFTTRRDRKTDFEVKIDPALKRARTIVQDWAKYGALMIVGTLPTSEELAQAREQRKDYAFNLLNKVDALLRAGKKAIPEMAEKAWAAEFGFQLREAVESLPRVSRDDTPCAFCDTLISGNAFVCKHCNREFKKMRLRDYLVYQAQREQAQPEQVIS